MTSVFNVFTAKTYPKSKKTTQTLPREVSIRAQLTGKTIQIPSIQTPRTNLKSVGEYHNIEESDSDQSGTIKFF